MELKNMSKEEIEVFVSKGLAKIAAYFTTTHGMPLEMFNELVTTRLKNLAEQTVFVMDFKKKHPDLWQ